VKDNQAQLRELPIEGEDRLREVALWMFVNGECVHGVRAWIVTHEIESLSAVRIDFGMVEMRCDLYALGDATAVEASAEYRDHTGLDVNQRTENWSASPVRPLTATGQFMIPFEGLQPGRAHELRAKVKKDVTPAWSASGWMKKHP
jgi:hypothetical protein